MTIAGTASARDAYDSDKATADQLSLPHTWRVERVSQEQPRNGGRPRDVVQLRIGNHSLTVVSSSAGRSVTVFLDDEELS
jgi:hypothetical protein